ncbi:MAG: hypothetical protein J6A59_18915 [Lachnospiraceae bacterium]|nr:hypothetical protein [Lachnospiraceae bacterium]
MELKDEIKSIAIRAKILGNKVEILDENTILLEDRHNLGYVVYYSKNGEVKHKEFSQCIIKRIHNTKYLYVSNIRNKYTSVIDYNTNILIDETTDYINHIYGDFFKIDVTSQLIKVVNCKTKQKTYPEYIDMLAYKFNTKCTFVMIKRLAIDIYNNELELIYRYNIGTEAIHKLVTVYEEYIQIADSYGRCILISHKGKEISRLNTIDEIKIENKGLNKAIRIY